LLEVNRRNMVEQKHEVKTSSIQKPEYAGVGHRGLPEYKFPCFIEPVSLVPEITVVKIVDDLGPGYVEGVPGYFILGSLQKTVESWWPEPPHIAFANLLAEDPKAAQSFTRRYGVLSRVYMDRDDPDGRRFMIDSATFIATQDRLRQAWPGENSAHIPALVDIEGEVEESFDTDVVVGGGFVHLRPKHLWASICFLFLWDSDAEKLGFCGNPDCPAPYFRKKRRTQKYCEAGFCADFARRKHALHYWNTKGKKRRDKQSKRRVE
jgi:hypothetical protein